MTPSTDWGVRARDLLGERGIAVDENAAERATTTAALLAAAMRVCDQHGDSRAARDEMRTDCLALPPHLQVDLLDHFRKADHLPCQSRNTENLK